MSSETISVEKMDSEDFKSRVPKINDYIWARYVDVSDDYPHELDEAEALENLESFYALPSEQENQDVVYLGVLLFERGFVDEDNKLEYFKRAYQIFERYRRVTGEHDWDVVEDRLEDILGFFEEENIDPAEQVAEETGGVPEGMVLIPNGPFLFGENREAREIEAFYVDVTPVTNQQYLKFCEATGYRKPRFHDDPRFNDPKQPVVGISHVDASQYCQHAGKELPTQEQWEKAARGTDGRRFPWGDDTPDNERACFDQAVDAGRPGSVGSLEKGASPYGCLDMSGNVWEWTATAPTNGNGEPIESERILRGGCYEDSADFLTTFSQVNDDQKLKSEIVGFRCVMKV